MSIGELALVPRPQVLQVTGVGPLVDACAVATAVDPAIRPQGFRLDIDADGARITHADDAGLRYGRALLGQLLDRPVEGRVLGVHVEDHPDIAVRAFMLDVSRDRVPTRETLGEYVEVLALARYNQLQLYTEHSFAHEGHDVVWRDASPLTPDDLTWLDSRCADAGIELVANRNCFGHFERWLSHPQYVDRAEAPEGVEVMAGLRFPPAVLAPTPDNAAFALDLVREQMGAVRSQRVNIGCDETFELGRGVSAQACAERGKGAVYLEHVRRLVDPLLADGYEVQIWADVLRRYPELASTLPEGVVPVAWLYEAPSAPEDRPDIPDALATVLYDLGIDTDTSGGFEANIAPLAAAGVPFWVAPGTSDWNSLVGRWDNALANQLDAAEVAIRHGAGGYLVAAWGDNGHHHPPSITYGPLIHGGAVAWCLEANRDLDVALVLDRHVFDDHGEQLGGAIQTLGGLWRRTGRQGLNASPLAAALFPHLPLLVTGAADPDAVRDVLAALDDVDGRIADAQISGPGARQLIAELTTVTRLARQGAWRLLGDGEGDVEGVPALADRADDLADVISSQRTAWLGRARIGGLVDSLAHLERTLAADEAALDG